MTRDPMTLQDQLLTIAIFATALPAMFAALTWSDRRARASNTRPVGSPRSLPGRVFDGQARTVRRAAAHPTPGGDGVRPRPPGQPTTRRQG